MDDLEKTSFVLVIKELKEKHGDFFLNYLSETNGKWGRWMLASEWIEIIEKGEHIYPSDYPNQRQVFPNEIIVELDADTKELNENNAKNIIIPILQKMYISYKVFWSGNKSQHIHVEIDDIDKLKPSLRSFYKKEWLKWFFGHYVDDCRIDLSVNNAKHTIQMEYTPHRKTGKMKELMSREWMGRKCGIDQEILKRAKRLDNFYTESQKVIKVNVMKGLNCPFLDFAITNELPPGSRDLVVTKNLAIYLYNSGSDKLEELARQYSLTQKKPVGELVGWMRKARDGHIKYINQMEINGLQRKILSDGFKLPDWARCVNCPHLVKCRDEQLSPLSDLKETLKQKAKDKELIG